MILTVKPTPHLEGRVTVPGDKSISHRAAIFGAVATGTTRIENFLRAGDTRSTLSCLKQLGAEISDDGKIITINGSGWNGLRAPGEVLDCGNSGTTIRLLMGVLAGRNFESTLAGDESLSRRPMDRVRVPLQQMGAQISGAGEKNTPPISVRGGNLHGIEYALPVASAQVKSAILLAGLQAEGSTRVIEPSATRDHTERMLRGFGVEVKQHGLVVEVQESELRGTEVNVPGDISSAAFFWCAAALRPGWKVTVEGVGLNPTRTGVLDVLEAMGAQIEINNQSESGGEPRGDVTVTGAQLKSTRIAGDLIPRLIDEIPVLALLATQAEGETVIADARELRVKESDRIAVLAREFRKLGIEVEEREDGMALRGPQKLIGAQVESPRGDHRIAMTLAVAGLIAEGETTIHNADAVQSSFPNFSELLQQLGASVSQ
jgi:3-phosphoshikimate 1-carboxyvinyltransferase